MRFLLAILLLLAVAPAAAQQGQGMSQALVVSSCGGATLTAGPVAQLTMDATGRLCLGGTFGVVSVWSTADAAANGMVLSNGGLTVTTNTANWQTIRSTNSKTTGKVYVEFYINSFSSSMMFGLANAGFDVTVSNSYLGSAIYSVGMQPTAGVNASSGFTSNYGGVPAAGNGDVLGIAVDFGAGSVWIAKNNVWVGGSNPATGSLPIVSFVPATVGALFPGYSVFTVSTVTLQPTSSSQTYAAPSGFSAWN